MTPVYHSRNGIARRERGPEEVLSAPHGPPPRSKGEDDVLPPPEPMSEVLAPSHNHAHQAPSLGTWPELTLPGRGCRQPSACRRTCTQSYSGKQWSGMSRSTTWSPEPSTNTCADWAPPIHLPNAPLRQLETSLEITKCPVVAFSRGMQSATAAAMAHRHGFETYPVSFRYGQRHTVELATAQRVAPPLQHTEEHPIAAWSPASGVHTWCADGCGPARHLRCR